MSALHCTAVYLVVEVMVTAAGKGGGAPPASPVSRGAGASGCPRASDDDDDDGAVVLPVPVGWVFPGGGEVPWRFPLSLLRRLTPHTLHLAPAPALTGPAATAPGLGLGLGLGVITPSSHSALKVSRGRTLARHES